MKIIFLFFFLLLSIFSQGQTPFKRNDIYLEAGGNGLWSSVNYERQVTRQPGLGIRIGMGFYTEHAFYLTIPASINYLFPLKNHKSFIDAGLGITWARIDEKLFASDKYSNEEHFVNFIPSIGYRIHTVKDVMWRFSITPVVNNDAFTPWIGISLGKRF